jgi:hypothetical protein
MVWSRMTQKGHEDQFPLRRLTARSVIRKRTVAATRGNGRDAPIPDLPGLGPGAGRFDPLLTFGPAHEIETHAPPDFPEFIKLYDFWEGLRRMINHKV